MATKTIKLAALALILAPAVALGAVSIAPASAPSAYSIAITGYTSGFSDFLVYPYFDGCTNPSTGSVACGHTGTLDTLGSAFGDIPVGSYNVIEDEVAADCFGSGLSLQDCIDAGNTAVPFSIAAVGGGGGLSISIPQSAATSVLEGVSNQLSDAGTLTLVAMIASIPLSFYVIKRLIKLAPSDGSKGRDTSKK